MPQPQYRSRNPELAGLEAQAKVSQCAPCGEAGAPGDLRPRWNGLGHVLSCNTHGDSPRTRPIDWDYESRREHGIKAAYGETRDVPLEQEESGEVLDYRREELWG